MDRDFSLGRNQALGLTIEPVPDELKAASKQVSAVGRSVGDALADRGIDGRLDRRCVVGLAVTDRALTSADASCCGVSTATDTRDRMRRQSGAHVVVDREELVPVARGWRICAVIVVGLEPVLRQHRVLVEIPAPANMSGDQNRSREMFGERYPS